MTTLETLLKGRLGGDARALTGAIEEIDGATRILFGDLGGLPRIVLGIEGDTVTVLHPSNITNQEDGMAEVKTREGEDTQQATRLDTGADAPLPNPAPASNAEATAITANAIGGANGVEGQGATGNAPTPSPVFIGKDDHSKAELLEIASKTPGAIFDENMTKAEIAQAINEKTGAIPPTE